MSQEIMLLSIINAPYISQELISTFQAISFTNLRFLVSYLIPLFSAENRGEEKYNFLNDNSQYHPSIFGIFHNSNYEKEKYF